MTTSLGERKPVKLRLKLTLFHILFEVNKHTYDHNQIFTKETMDLSGYICEMCHKYKIKFGGSTCSSQVISQTKPKQNLNNYKIKVYYSVGICTKELTMLLLSLLLPISPLV